MNQQQGIEGTLTDASGFCVAFHYNTAHAAEISELAQADKARVTACWLTLDGNMGRSKLGTAHCSPRDNFERERGRKIALARALRRSGLDKPNRTRVWEAYRARGQEHGPVHV